MSSTSNTIYFCTFLLKNIKLVFSFFFFKQTAQTRDRHAQVAAAEAAGLPPPVFSPDRRFKRTNPGPAAPGPVAAEQAAPGPVAAEQAAPGPAAPLKVSSSLFKKGAVKKGKSNVPQSVSMNFTS